MGEPSHSDNATLDLTLQNANDFNVECMKCHSLNDINSVVFIPSQLDLRSFLLSSVEGNVILFHYQKFHSLNDAMRNSLTHLLTNRELFSILKKNNVTLENPLQKLEVPSQVLKNLASEVAAVFQDRPGIYYTPSVTDGKNRVNASGKFIQRINYMRTIFVESGLLVYPNKNTDSTSSDQNLTGADTEEQLLILKQNQKTWDEILKAWNSTFQIRQSLVKSRGGTNLWEFTEYPCLARSSGLELLIADFNRIYPDAVKIEDKWQLLRSKLEKFILSKNITAREALFFLKELPQLEDEDKDAVILQLLPLALKAPEKKVKKSTPKRKKIDTSEKENSEASNTNFDDFILRVKVAADVDKNIEAKRLHYHSKGESLQPFIVFVGSSISPEAYYVVVDNIKYTLSTALKALDATFKIFFSTNCQYPKSDRQVWLFIQKIVYCMEFKGDKFGVVLNNAISHFEKVLTTEKQ